MADDVVDTIAQYDLDDDFPDYANEQNKELNQIVSPAIGEIEQLIYYFGIFVNRFTLGQRESQACGSARLRNRGAPGTIEDSSRAP